MCAPYDFILAIEAARADDARIQREVFSPRWRAREDLAFWGDLCSGAYWPVGTPPSRFPHAYSYRIRNARTVTIEP